MAEGKKLEELSDKEKKEMKNKAKVETFFGIVRTEFMTLRVEEIAAISRDEPTTKENGGSLTLVFKQGNAQSLRYNSLEARDKDYKKIDDAMCQTAMIPKPTKDLDK